MHTAAADACRGVLPHLLGSFYSSAVCAHAQVMAGQGTVAVELLQQLPQGLDAVIVPVGGGGLIGGIAAVLKAWQPSVQVCPRGSGWTAAAPRLGRHGLHHVHWPIAVYQSRGRH